MLDRQELTLQSAHLLVSRGQFGLSQRLKTQVHANPTKRLAASASVRDVFSGFKINR